MDAVETAARNAKDASYRLQSLTQAVRNEALQEIAAALLEHADEIVNANRADTDEAEKAGLSKVMVKRLGYDRSKIKESVTVQNTPDQRVLLEIGELPKEMR